MQESISQEADVIEPEEEPQGEYNEIIPPVGDPEVGKVAMGYVYKCIKHQQNKGYYKKWAMYEDMGRNIHYTSNSDTEGIPLTSCNLLHKHRTKALNSLFSKKPTFNAKPIGNLTDEQAEKLKLVERQAEHWFRERHALETFRQKIGFYGETDGTYIGKMMYDPKAEGGVGEAILCDVNPRHFLVYPPDATNVQEADICILLKPMTVRAAKRAYPAFSGKIRPDSDVIGKVTQEDGDQGTSTSDYTYEIDDETYTHLGMGEAGDDDKKTMVVELWVRDYSGKYTGNIRVITVCSAGEVVLEDVDNKSVNPNMPKEFRDIIYLTDKVPFFTAQSIPDPSTIWGGSDFDHLSQMNKDLDKALTFLNILLEEASGTTLKNAQTSGVTNDELQQKGSKIINPHTPELGMGIGYVDPPPIPPVIPITIELFKTLFYEIAATSDINQANTGGKNVIGEKALAILQEQQNLSLVGKQMSVEYCIDECGRMQTSLAQSFYVTERFISYKEQGETQQTPISAQALQIPVKLSIVPGSMMPVSKVQQREEAQGLYNMHVVDQPYLLQHHEIEGWREIVARMKEGPMGEALKKLTVLEPWLTDEQKQTILKLFVMEMKDFEKLMEAGKIGEIQPPQPQQKGPDPVEQRGIKAEQDKVITENAERMAKTKKIEAEIREIDKKLEKIDAEIRKVNADTEKTDAERKVSIEGSKRDKEQLEIDRARFTTELADRDNPEKMSDKNTAGFREKGMKSNNKE